MIAKKRSKRFCQDCFIERMREYDRVWKRNARKDTGYREKYKISQKKSYQKHRRKRLEEKRKYLIENRELINERRKSYNVDLEKAKRTKREYYLKHREKDLIRRRLHKQRNKEHNRAYYREYRKKYKKRTVIADALSKAIRRSLRSNKNNISTPKALGYSIDEVKAHLESQFKKGMSWSNYGKVWHIDHRIPLSWFNISTIDSEEFKKAWALENLQPLFAQENRSKQDKYAEPTLVQIAKHGGVQNRR